MLTHALPPLIGVHAAGVPPAHATPQLDAAQEACPVAAPETGAAQALPQLPQCCGSVFSLKHPVGH